MKKTIISVLGALALVSCTNTAKNESAMDITGNWSIEKAMGLSTKDGEDPAFINFNKDGNMNGSTSVNSFMGGYTLNGEALALTNIGVTKRMGASMEIEDAVINALNTTATIKVDANKAYVLDTKNDTVMVLVKE